MRQTARFDGALTEICNDNFAFVAFMLAWSSVMILLLSGCTTYNMATPSTPYSQTSPVQFGHQLPWALPPTDPSSAKLPVAPRYFASDPHTATELLSNGKFLVLEDNTVWMVNELDTHTAALWSAPTQIAILESQHNGYIFHHLIRLNDGESLSATYLGTVALRTYINGKFEGWEGDTVFILLNGQIVKQADYKTFYYYTYNPMVLFVNIGVPGLYEMIVNGVQDKIGVYVVQ